MVKYITIIFIGLVLYLILFFVLDTYANTPCLIENLPSVNTKFTLSVWQNGVKIHYDKNLSFNKIQKLTNGDISYHKANNKRVLVSGNFLVILEEQ